MTKKLSAKELESLYLFVLKLIYSNELKLFFFEKHSSFIFSIISLKQSELQV